MKKDKTARRQRRIKLDQWRTCTGPKSHRRGAPGAFGKKLRHPIRDAGDIPKKHVHPRSKPRKANVSSS